MKPMPRSTQRRSGSPSTHRRAGRGRRVVTATALIAAAFGACTASAQSIDRESQMFWARGAVFQARIDSLLRIDYVGSPELGLPGAGTTVDFEGTLGLPVTQTRGDLLLGLRLFERGRLELQQYSLRRSGTRQLLDESIVVNGVTYSAQARLTTSFESQVTRLGLGYSLLKTPTAEAGVMLGVQYTRYRLRLVGEGSINNEPPASSGVEESDNGPLPTLGAYGSFALAAGWSLHLSADYLPVDSSRVRGGLGAAELNLYRQITPNLSAGLGVRHVQYKIERKSSGELRSRFEYQFTGPQLMLELGF